MANNRIGTVLVFKKGVSAVQAAAALDGISRFLDLPETTTAYEPTGESNLSVEQLRTGRRSVRPVERPFQMKDKIHEFDDYGGKGPAWYIP